MQCPNCLGNIRTGHICPHCTIDTYLYANITKLSDRLYNRGLERLRFSDYFHGIDFLRKSIAINKNNVPARNLLGLALYETGHVGEALQHWVLSKSLLSEENPAERYIDEVHKNEKTLERYNEASVMFNRALAQIKQKSDDLAIIQLKKAVESNPRFIDALNLLTLCHLIQNDRESAGKTLERVLTLDAYNPVALNYYSLLFPNRTRPAKPAVQNAQKAAKPQVTAAVPAASAGAGGTIPFQPIQVQPKKKGSFPIAEILTFIIGALAVAAVFYFVMLPGIERDHQDALAEVVIQREAETLVVRGQLSSAQQSVTELSSEVDTLQAENESLDIEVDELRRINAIHQAYWLFLEEEFQRAVDIIDDIIVDDLPFDIIRRVDSIYDGAYPYLGVYHFDEGVAAFNGDDPEGSVESLELALRFMRPRDSGIDEEVEYPAQWNQLLFMLGSLYYEDGRFSEAYDLLFELAERAPNVQTAAVTTMLESIADALE